jgi:hypothetical protein
MAQRLIWDAFPRACYSYLLLVAVRLNVTPDVEIMKDVLRMKRTESVGILSANWP